MRKGRTVRSVVAAFLMQTGIAGLPIAKAQDVVIPSGTTVFTTQTIANPEDTLTVEDGGAIDTSGSSGDGVDASGDNQTVKNQGKITVIENGISSTAQNVVISNTGTITTEISPLINDDIGIGIYSDGDAAHIENTGAITAVNYGIRSKKGDAKIINTGRIDALNHGIRSDGENAMVINYGTVNGDSQGVVVGIHAIRSGGASSVVANYGTLLSQDDGIFYVGDNAVISNYGVIKPGGWGIGSQGDSSKIINAGTILAGNGDGAINLVGMESELILQPGSVLVGDIAFFGISETLTLDPGHNLVLRYQGAFSNLNTSMPVIHDSGDMMIYSVDPTGFALSQSFIQTMAGAVHETVRSGSASDSSTGSAVFGFDNAGSDQAAENRSGWVAAFGGYQTQNGLGAVTGGNQAYGGITTGGGIDDGERSIGAFLGSSYSQLKTDAGSQEIDAASFLGGLYFAHPFGETFRITGSVLGGYTRFNSDRIIANNTIAGGLETAVADYSGYVISPSVTLAHTLTERTEVSIGGYYAGLFIDGYNETGSSTNLTVSSRDIHIAAVRLQARYLAYQQQTNKGHLTVETWAGVDGNFLLGGDAVGVQLAGTPLSFPATFAKASAIGFAGIGFNHTPSIGNWSVNTSLEGRFGTEGYAEITAAASAFLRF
ncbi:autotransporter outer membrane beta-barrel domain-containing protein [Hoeflea prorocentri]|uniref:Autotransporter domain-containing protein n=1 Tax=Hoeflea prorocentri TaxID=1922333 RepID=A0A9X3UI09_9HYPH|nr:autotransporter domain-containing protein [Hoeflea prorocentri]MCY6380981.1 autotransporter domain-containing protein [Hoeflea prorocentri]MDA5398781.1 autotransporter domain-containing protein [Hoeflea prorocentri]